jgi:hypothetical protein
MYPVVELGYAGRIAGAVCSLGGSSVLAGFADRTGVEGRAGSEGAGFGAVGAGELIGV